MLEVSQDLVYVSNGRNMFKLMYVIYKLFLIKLRGVEKWSIIEFAILDKEQVTPLESLLFGILILFFVHLFDHLLFLKKKILNSFLTIGIGRINSQVFRE